MRLSSTVLIFLSISLSISVVSAAAQSANSPRYEVAGGYQFMRDQDIAKQDPDLSANFPAGWMASGGAHLWSWLGVVGEVSGSAKTLSIPGDKPKLRVYTFMAGPRWSDRQGQITPWAQVLVGMANLSGSVFGITASETDLAIQPGGGIDFDVNGSFGVRLGGNLRFIRSAGETGKEFQFVAGIVMHSR